MALVTALMALVTALMANGTPWESGSKLLKMVSSCESFQRTPRWVSLCESFQRTPRWVSSCESFSNHSSLITTTHFKKNANLSTMITQLSTRL